MDLILTRTQKGEDGIFGELSCAAKGAVICLTLEHAYHVNGSYSPKLPAGEYLCQRGVHSLAHGHPFETFEVTGVPDHTGILYHIGNYNIDSSGCVLLGQERIQYLPSKFMINYSKKTFQKFMQIQDGVDLFSLLVR